MYFVLFIILFICIKSIFQASVTSHLQTVSLVENVRLETNLLLELVQFYNCDVRKCLTMLQFILLSGGGHSQTHKPFQRSNVSKTALYRYGLDADNSQSAFDAVCKPAETVIVDDGNSKDTDHSDDDFVCFKPLKKRRRVLDEDSNSVDATKFSVVKPNNVLATEKNEPDLLSATVHCIGVETLFRNGNMSVADIVTQGLKVFVEHCSFHIFYLNVLFSCITFFVWDHFL